MRLSGQIWSRTAEGVDGAQGLRGRVGVSPAGEGILPERTIEHEQKTAPQDAPLGGRDARRNCARRVAGLDRGERGFQVFAQVFHVLYPDREPNERLSDTKGDSLFLRNGAVRHDRRIVHQAFDPSEALGERE